jgi:hypothetical protein
MMAAQRRFTLTLLAASGRDGIHELRALLKTLGHRRWRCVGAREESSSANRRIDVEKSDLEKLRGYAAASRSQVNFAGATFIKFDWKVGKWTAGKAGTDMTGRQLVADLPDAMGGFQRFESGQKPQYALTQILDSAVAPIERDDLGDTDYLDKDPWVAVTVIPFFNPETHQVFVVSAAYSARDAASNLIDALLDHIAAEPEAATKLPIVTLGVREYTKGDGNPGYAAQFDIEGWVDRPASVLHVKPPPLTITVEAASKTTSTTNGTSATSALSAKAESSDGTAKPKRKVAVSAMPGKADFDDTIPF